MMYSEFIENSNFTEHYISYAEYTTYIEPIYMGAEQIPTKQEFITLLQDTFKTLCHPVVETGSFSLSNTGSSQTLPAMKHISQRKKSMIYVKEHVKDFKLPNLQVNRSDRFRDRNLSPRNQLQQRRLSRNTTKLSVVL